MLKPSNKALALWLGSSLLVTASAQTNSSTSTKLPPIADGPFKPASESLATQYKTPEWFRDAKLGIRAYWGPQCEPEQGEKPPCKIAFAIKIEA